MKHSMTIFIIGCALVLPLFNACNQKPAALKEGVITKVVWPTEVNNKTGLYREKMPQQPRPGENGTFSVDMYGVLYPSHLEVRFVGSRDSHSQIIPFSQIVWLEFGDGGVTVSK